MVRGWTHWLMAALGLVLMCAPLARAEEVLVDASNPPFMYADSSGQALGVYPAILTEAFKRLNIPLDLKAQPWKRAIAALDQGSAGVGGIYKNAERLQKYDYSDKLFDEVILVYTRADNGLTYKDLGSLQGKTVGVLLGWSYGDDFDAWAKDGKIMADAVGDDKSNFTKLASGRLDAVLAIRESGDMVLANPEMAAKIKAQAVPLSSAPSFLAFNKSQAKTGLLAKFNQVLAQMRQDQTFDTLVRQALVK